MRDAKHTKGPWHNGGVWRDDKDCIYSGSMRIARVDKTRHHKAEGVPIEGSWEANARLIAAAPQLLAALESVLDSLRALCNHGELEGWGMSDKEQRAVWVAISRAKGEDL